MKEATVDRLLTLEEAAAVLRKTPKQLRWLMYSGSAPRSALIGGRRMFRSSDIEAFIAAAFDAEPRAELTA